jgi:hypothetical protein
MSVEVIAETFWVYVDQSQVRTLTKVIVENMKKERTERWVQGAKPISKEEVMRLFALFQPSQVHASSVPLRV